MGQQLSAVENKLVLVLVLMFPWPEREGEKACRDEEVVNDEGIFPPFS